MTDAETETTDPFHPSNAQALNFIMQARIYDVLMGLLTEANPLLARDLLEIHAAGHLMGASPGFSGKFIADEMEDE